MDMSELTEQERAILGEVEDRVRLTVAIAVEAAREAERERCAKIVESEPVKERYCVGRDLLTVDDAAATKKAIVARIRSGE